MSNKLDYKLAIVSGERRAIIRANKEWKKFEKDCSWLYTSGVIKDKEMMKLIRFCWNAGWDSAILGDFSLSHSKGETK